MEAENHSNCDITVAAAVKGFFFKQMDLSGRLLLDGHVVSSFAYVVTFPLRVLTMNSYVCVLACQSSFLHGQNVMHQIIWQKARY